MSIDYTNFSNEDTYDDSVVTEVSYEEIGKQIWMGKISNAEKVYLRSEPAVRDGNDMKILDKDTEVLINDIFDEWCEVCTESGLEGYVMKKFIDIS